MSRNHFIKVAIAAMITFAIVVWSLSFGLRSYTAFRDTQHQHHQRQVERSLRMAKYAYEQQDYQGCLVELEQIGDRSPFAEQVDDLKRRCISSWSAALLRQAQASAGEGYFWQGIEYLRQIPDGSHYQKIVNQLTRDWGVKILEIAADADAKGQVDLAVNYLSHVQEWHPLYDDAQALMESIQTRWDAQVSNLNRARELIQSGEARQLQQARQLLNSIDHPGLQAEVKEWEQQWRVAQENLRRQQQITHWLNTMAILFSGGGVAIAFARGR
jgi:hypothetical protein